MESDLEIQVDGVNRPASDQDIVVDAYSELETRKTELCLKDVLPFFRCPLCQDVLVNTMLLSACLHRFCEGCIHGWFRTGACGCPVCGTRSPPNGCLSDITFEQLLVAILGRRTTRPAAEGFPSAVALEQGGSSSQSRQRIVQYDKVGETKGIDVMKGIKRWRRDGNISNSKAMRIEKDSEVGTSKLEQIYPTRAPSLCTLRPAAVIVKFKNVSPSSSVGSDWKTKYVACPLKRTVLELKHAFLRGINSRHEHSMSEQNFGTKKNKLLFRLPITVPRSVAGKIETENGLKDSVSIGHLVNCLGVAGPDLEIHFADLHARSETGS